MSNVIVFLRALEILLLTTQLTYFIIDLLQVAVV